MVGRNMSHQPVGFRILQIIHLRKLYVTTNLFPRVEVRCSKMSLKISGRLSVPHWLVTAANRAPATHLDPVATRTGRPWRRFCKLKPVPTKGTEGRGGRKRQPRHNYRGYGTAWSTGIGAPAIDRTGYFFIWICVSWKIGIDSRIHIESKWFGIESIESI